MAGEEDKKRRHSLPPPPPPLPSQCETHAPGRCRRATSAAEGAQRGSAGPGTPLPDRGSPLTCHPHSGRPLPAPLPAAVPPPLQVCLKRPPHPAAISHPLSLPPSLFLFPSLVQPAGKKPAAPGAMESLALPTSGGRGGTHRRGGGQSPSATPGFSGPSAAPHLDEPGQAFSLRVSWPPNSPRSSAPGQSYSPEGCATSLPKRTRQGEAGARLVQDPARAGHGGLLGKAQPPRALLQRRDS